MTYDAKEKSQYLGAPIELYRFAVGDAVFYYTSTDENQTYLGNLYTTEPIHRTEIDQSGEAESAKITITLGRTNPVAAYFIDYTPEPPMTITVLRFHREDVEVLPIFVGKVASASFSGGKAKLSCLPIFEALRTNIPVNTYQSQCNWALYSAQCGIAKASWATAGVVTVISGDTIQATAFGAFADGWFSNGWVETADGDRRWIVDHDGAELTLMSAFTSLSVNDTVTAYAGCDRTEAICLAKFSNVVNFLGFSRVPTRNPFRSGL